MDNVFKDIKENLEAKRIVKNIENIVNELQSKKFNHAHDYDLQYNNYNDINLQQNKVFNFMIGIDVVCNYVSLVLHELNYNSETSVIKTSFNYIRMACVDNKLFSDACYENEDMRAGMKFASREILWELRDVFNLKLTD